MALSLPSSRTFIAVVFLHALLTVYLGSRLHYGGSLSRDINNQSKSSTGIILIDGIRMNLADYQRLKQLVVKAITRKVVKQTSKTENSVKDFQHTMTSYPLSSATIDNCTDEFRHSHFLTLSRHLGRAGNWMFQLAALLATAKSLCYTPVLQTTFGSSPTFTLDDILDVKNVTRVDPWDVQGWKVFTEQSPCKYSQLIENLDNRYNWSLNGFFQSWRYFHDHRDYVRETLTFPLDVMTAAEAFYKMISYGQITSKVCLHVRRRDMLKQKVKEFGFNVGNLSFIKAAMTLVRKAFHETGNDVRFVVVTDDLPWCLRNIYGGDVLFSPFTAERDVEIDNFKYDLALMSLCDHAIITGGSFGWIGGWLTRGAVIYYSDFHKKGSTFFQHYDSSDYYPADWVGLGDRELSAWYTSNNP